MAETTEKTGEKKLSVAPTKALSLKGRGIEQGVVRQSFSHGRTKAVVVEKVKSRAPTRARPEAGAAAPAKRPADGKTAPPRLLRLGPTPAAPGPQAFRRGAANPDRGRAHRPRARARRRSFARGGRAQDCGRRSADPQVARIGRATGTRRRRVAQGRRRQASQARIGDQAQSGAGGEKALRRRCRGRQAGRRAAGARTG